MENLIDAENTLERRSFDSVETRVKKRAIFNIRVLSSLQSGRGEIWMDASTGKHATGLKVDFFAKRRGIRVFMRKGYKNKPFVRYYFFDLKSKTSWEYFFKIENFLLIIFNYLNSKITVSLTVEKFYSKLAHSSKFDESFFSSFIFIATDARKINRMTKIHRSKNKLYGWACGGVSRIRARF